MKNKPGLFITIFFLIVFGGILLSACDNPYNKPEVFEQDESVLVRIGLSGGSGRSILPDMPRMEDITLFELWGTALGLDESWLADFADLNDASVLLKPGTWDFTLKAVGADNYYVYVGVKKSVTITSGYSGTIAFTLLPYRDYDGWANVVIELPPDIDVASVETVIDGEILDPPLEIDDGVIEYNENLEAGEYFIVFKLKNSYGVTIAAISEILVIRNGVLSTKTYILSDDDFNRPPDTPSNFMADAYTSGNITFTWENVSRNETGFILNDGTTEYAINAGLTSYTFPLTNPSGMTFTLKAVNDFGESEKAEYTVVLPETPSGLTAEALSPSSIRLSWEADDIAINYIIQRSNSEEGTYTQIATTIEISYDDTDLLPSTTYYYKVIAHSIVGDSPASDVVSAQTEGNPIQLTLGIWADGNIATSSGEQWFKFTATAATQYLHVSFGTLTDLNVQVYNSNGDTVESETNLSVTNVYGDTASASLSVTSGQEYYIKVTPYSSSDNGTYLIAFNTSATAPVLLPWRGADVTTLTANLWRIGNITGNEQWFKFTATATAQYLHVTFGTLTNLFVQVYNSSGATVGSQTNLNNSTRSASRSVTSGQEYYIKVTPYSSSDNGTYFIAFTATAYPPGTNITTLTANIWASGNITTSSGEQWFKFTATAATQYLHVSFGTLKDLNVQVYNSSGAIVGNQTNLFSNTKSTSRSVTSGQEYYIKITPYSSSGNGTYQIAFNTTIFPPGTTTLTANTWANGNIATSSGEQWFKFTATAATQYLHVSFGTLTDLYVQVYTSSGATVGSQSNLYDSTKSTSRSVTSGQEYYIKVTPYNSSDNGTYKIVFNTSTTAPLLWSGYTVTTLTSTNTWVNGNITTADGEQWFKFTATAATQYLHVNLGTLTNLYVQVYTSSGATVGSQSNFNGGTTHTISRSLTSGQVYYIRVLPYSSSDSGTYQIAFHQYSTLPRN